MGVTRSSTITALRASFLGLLSLSLSSALCWHPVYEASTRNTARPGGHAGTIPFIPDVAGGSEGGGFGRLGGKLSPQFPLAFAGGPTLPGANGFVGRLHSSCRMHGRRREGVVLGQARMGKSEEGGEGGLQKSPILLDKPSDRDRDRSRARETGIALPSGGVTTLVLEGGGGDVRRRAVLDARIARLAGPMHLPLLEEHTWHEPFVTPRERHLVDVPTQFGSGEHFCKVLGHNLLAELWHVVRDAPPGPEMSANASAEDPNGRGWINQLRFMPAAEGAPELAPERGDTFVHHLLLVNRTRHLVSSCVDGDPLKVTVRPSLSVGAGPCVVQSLGYFGTYVSELRALTALSVDQAPPPVFASILNPKVDVRGEYGTAPIRKHLQPINSSQRQVIEALKFALEKIQGPPGTGKSTTVFHIIDKVLPELRTRAPSRQGHAGVRRVLVTCSRNVAVESIAQKLAGLHAGPYGRSSMERMVVVGSAARVGATASEYCLDAHLARDPDLALKAARCAFEHAEAGHAVSDPATSGYEALQELVTCRDALRAEERRVSREILGERTQVFLCTVASTSRLLILWQDLFGDERPLEMHTVVVDECGCTTESSVALLLRLKPTNLILVGDHKQLPPSTFVPPYELHGTGHARSLLERCALVSGINHLLREQYRMHSAICAVVGTRFYQGKLQTPTDVARQRETECGVPLCWVPVRGEESHPPRSRSYVNEQEVEVAVRVAGSLSARHPTASVAILTFYKAHFRALEKAVQEAKLMGVEVLTVDACQGAEFDYVVLSTVRSNRGREIGFARDAQRINVAISRAKRHLAVVGNPETLAGKGSADWKALFTACTVVEPDAYLPPDAPQVDAEAVARFFEARAARLEKSDGREDVATGRKTLQPVAMPRVALWDGARDVGDGGEGGTLERGTARRLDGESDIREVGEGEQVRRQKAEADVKAKASAEAKANGSTELARVRAEIAAKAKSDEKARRKADAVAKAKTAR